MAKDNTWAVILGIAAVGGAVYLLSRKTGEGEDGEGGGFFPGINLPDISSPSMPSFSLPQISAPSFSLPSLDLGGLGDLGNIIPEIPSIPKIPELPQVIPDIMPDFGGGDGVPLMQKILNLFGAGDKVIDPGSYEREAHVTTIEAGSIEVAGDEWQVIPQFPNLQMTTKDFLLEGMKQTFLNPFGTISNMLKYGSPVVEIVKSDSPAAIAAPQPESTSWSNLISKPLYDFSAPSIPSTSTPKPESSYTPKVESAAIPDSKPEPESDIPYEQGITGIYVIPTAERAAAKQVLDSSEFKVWLKDQQAGNFYDPVEPPPIPVKEQHPRC